MADDDLLANIPQVGVASAAPVQYLGVPEGYQAPNPYGGFSGFGYVPAKTQAPKYQDADVLAPGALSPERIAQLQEQLAKAGLYGGKKAVYRLGLWDDATQSAWAKVLSYANQSGLGQDDALSSLVAHPLPKDPATDGSDPGKVSKLTDAPTLEAQVQQAAQRRLGRKLRSSEVAKFVSLYQGLERKDNATYGAAQDAAAEGKDTTITPQAPGADVAAGDFIDSNNAQEAAGQDAYGYFDALKTLIGG